MYKVAVLGDRDSLSTFSLLGADTFELYDKKACADTLKKLSAEGYGVIFITEKLAEKTEDVLEKYKDKATPAIILIPGAEGNTGKGMKNVVDSIRRAVGSDISA